MSDFKKKRLIASENLAEAREDKKKLPITYRNHFVVK